MFVCTIPLSSCDMANSQSCFLILYRALGVVVVVYIHYTGGWENTEERQLEQPRKGGTGDGWGWSGGVSGKGV
jgi:hypothetical protein